MLHRSRSCADARITVAFGVGVLLALWLAFVLGPGRPRGVRPGAGRTAVADFRRGHAADPVFFVAYRTSAAFRDFVLNLDQRLAVGLQAWRFGGLGFIALTAYNVLPGAFAWPAGLGDIAIGATAPVLALSLARNPGLVSSRRFVAWNVLGILDLAVAVGTGTLVAWFGIGADSASMGPMAQLPLLLIPAFLVPVFVILHVAALFQARHAAAAAV